jgi:glycosyltransferase involved in cell wall biosynthesis
MADKSGTRVLMVDSEVTWRGGEAQVALLMRGLTARGLDVSLAAPPGSAIAEAALSLGVKVYPLSIAGGMDLRAAWKLRRYIRKKRFEIVHCHSSHAHGVAWLALGPGRKAWRRGPQSIHGRRARLVVSRRVDFAVGRNALSAIKYRRGVDKFLAISTGVRDVLVKCGVTEDKIELVPSGIDLAKFDGVGTATGLEEEFGVGETSTLIGNVAALAPHKSQADFIRAAAIIRREIPHARFVIVGDGELKGRLEALIRELGLERDFTMTGFRRDALGILALFDCFVLSSYLEGLCTSIMDAQAMGIPVVATRTGGVPDLVTDEETGLLVPPRDPGCLASAVVRMLRDTDLRKRCVERARAKAATYDYNRMVERTLEAYERVVGSR